LRRIPSASRLIAFPTSFHGHLCPYIISPHFWFRHHLDGPRYCEHAWRRIAPRVAAGLTMGYVSIAFGLIFTLSFCAAMAAAAIHK
jgi:hypothetical protein